MHNNIIQQKAVAKFEAPEHTVTEATGSVFCGDCDANLGHLPSDADERPPCPECGSTARKFVESIEETIGVTGSVQVQVNRAVEWVGEHPGWSALSLGVSMGGVVVPPFLGPVWGLSVGVALTGLSYWTMKKAIAEGRWPE